MKLASREIKCASGEDCDECAKELKRNEIRLVKEKTTWGMLAAVWSGEYLTPAVSAPATLPMPVNIVHEALSVVFDVKSARSAELLS